jgi:hypothetical protein
MRTVEAHIGKWFIQCIPEEGARISVLQYEGIDLLTGSPSDFKPPQMDYGEYETRPVYGYDDCFPTVDPCLYPQSGLACRDHGNICWMDWEVLHEGDRLACQVECLIPKVVFKRALEFHGHILKWKFGVINPTDSEFAFLHVMHALMPLQEVQSMHLPGFCQVIDERTSLELNAGEAVNVAGFLQDMPPGKFAMLLLKGIKQGAIYLDLSTGLTLKIGFNKNLFPTLGIWWNNSGYPEEEGRQRNECAFEPIPGSSSKLEQAFTDGTFLKVKPRGSLEWEISWQIQKKKQRSS